MREQKSTSSGTATAEMPNAHLHEPFIDGLKDIYDAEKQLVKAIPKLIKAATSQSLKDGLTHHLHETEGHVTRLETAFESIGESAKAKMCPVMKGLVEEGGEATKQKDTNSRDAAIIAAAQKVEHYEIATYGTLRAWAEAMGHDQAAQLLSDTLDEEKAADEKLTEIAEEGCGCSKDEADND
jgi:ferritin-like metal-binding protein YciE